MDESKPTCARSTWKHPDGATGTNAGYQAHYRVGESACDACKAANREYQSSRRVPMDPAEIMRRRRRAGRKAWEAKAADYVGRPLCEIPTSLHPDGRTGTVRGYYAHWYKGEPACEACLKAQADDIMKKRKADPLAYRKMALWSKFRITLDDYERMLGEQAGGCAICGAATPGHSGGSKSSGFHVDHDHGCCPGDRSCGRCVRGILCGPCNTGMGNLGDDPERLIAAANYLLAARKRRSDGTTPTQAGDAA